MNQRFLNSSLRLTFRGLAGISILSGVVLSGCENAGQGAVTGAGVGALSGLAIGSMSGNAGRGAAIGAVAGGAGGAVIGDQNRRATQASTPQPVPTTPPPAATQSQSQMSTADRDRLALARFARAWRVSGWETVAGQRRFVTGNAVGSIDSTFFVRLDISVSDDQTRRLNTGSVIFASEPGRGLTMNSRFDTSPFPITFAGTVSSDGMLFTMSEIAPGFGANAGRIVIRFISPEEFVADESDRSGAIGSLTFTAAR